MDKSLLDANEIDWKNRFRFGRNWRRFLGVLDEKRVRAAQTSLLDMTQRQDLHGVRMLDIGSGSGLFSLAAVKLGAKVTAFDFDPDSVECGQILKAMEPAAIQARWSVCQGSVLDAPFVDRLGTFELVYSWGVLHHTGAMWQAIHNAAGRVAAGGQLYIAIYNDQGWLSAFWTRVKRMYVRHLVMRPVLIAVFLPYLFLARYVVRALSGRLDDVRGMTLWYDMIDWLGGYPFEVARPEQVFQYVQKMGFTLQNLRTTNGRHGCNEFVFKKQTDA